MRSCRAARSSTPPPPGRVDDLTARHGVMCSAGRGATGAGPQSSPFHSSLRQPRSRRSPCRSIGFFDRPHGAAWRALALSHSSQRAQLRSADTLHDRTRAADERRCVNCCAASSARSFVHTAGAEPWRVWTRRGSAWRKRAAHNNAGRSGAEPSCARREREERVGGAHGVRRSLSA